MPNWIPRQQTVQEQLADEIAKQEAIRFVQQSQRTEPPAWTPLLTEPVNNITMGTTIPQKGIMAKSPQLKSAIDPAISVRNLPELTPIQQEIAGYMPDEYRPPQIQKYEARVPSVQGVGVSSEKASPLNKTEVKPAEPFWQRALQVFAAPFNWIDEYLIKPALSTAGTAVGIVPDVERKPGEDYFSWKRRSWSEWETPGVDIKVPWSDTPLRLDLKGIASFAPWLLIPGAGQVGSAARAGVGVAGTLGKLGKAGKVAGTIVEWSPWGLAEKTAGAAIKGTVKYGLKVSESVTTKLEAKVFGKIKTEPVAPSVQKLTKWVKEEVAPQFQKVREGMPELRKGQAASAQAAKDQANKLLREGKITPSQAVEMERKAMAGGIKQNFPIKSPFMDGEIDTNELINMARKADEMGLVKGILEETNVSEAMVDLLLNNVIPEPKQLKAFARIYGNEFASAVSSLKDVKPSNLEKIWDALNIPRAAMASGDLSGTFRQGLILTLNHPIEGMKAFGKQLKAFASEKVAMELDDTLRANKLYRLAKEDWGVDFTAVRKGATQGKEEVFISNIAEHLPGVRRSERAYTTYLNQMRMVGVEKAYATMTAQGATKEQFKLLGNFINLTTGRGKLPFTYEKYAPMFNAVLFSPKYQMSILQLPKQFGKMLISKNPYIRQQGALALTTFVGGGIGLLTLLEATGVGKFEKDPRSTDFAKLKIGDTRIDIWRGYAQYSRFIVQMLTGQRKSAFGYLSNAERGEIAGRFIQTKLSPAAGLIGELWRGETFQGEPVFTDTRGFLKSVREKTLPLAVQDVMDAMEQNGVNGLWTAAPALLGVGTLTYVNEYINAKNKVAKENGYDSWEEIDPKTQLEIQRNSVELQVAEITYDRQVMGTAWGDWHLAGKSIEELFRENVDLAVAQFKETGDGVLFRGKIKRAYDERKGGYGAREKEPRFTDIVDRLNTQDIAQADAVLGPEQLSIKAYQDALYGEDMYDQFNDYRFDEAEVRKEQLRFKLGDEAYKYVEDYIGEKTATLPPEFQELKKAKIVLRPYWEIADKIERLFGKRFAESPKGQSMISKLRKQMRATRPDIAKYYQLFYAK